MLLVGPRWALSGLIKFLQMLGTAAGYFRMDWHSFPPLFPAALIPKGR